jgi:farnesyl diphosphate synthase
LSLDTLIENSRQRVEKALDYWLPAESIIPIQLHQAMRYAALSGGKRVRPLLVYATGKAVGVTENHLDGPACAVELIHAYSLVHDDLPAMDDDDLRRGQPTLHIKFNEPTAILAGDAMQALAYHILAHDENMVANAELRLKMINTLALASGSRGMAGGQAIDLDSVGKDLNIAELENMHIHKTGALIRASILMGALSADAISPTHLDRLDSYGKAIGLAFQIRDDILDVECDTETLGKTQGADAARNKPTYPSLVGMTGAKDMCHELVQEALEHLSGFDETADSLREIARYIIDRQN